jgi:N-acetylmuramoyl-L-alanine amidase
MQIKRHRLHLPDGAEAAFESSPNTGGRLTPRYLVMHYTAGGSADQSISWLTNPRARASAHVVVGRDGTVTQLVAFNTVAWHAGRSRWDGLVGMNHHSIGIELDNAGRLTRQGGVWRAWFGAVIPDDEVMEATHPHEEAPAGWQIYPREQIEASLDLARELVEKYDLIDVVGHEDISPYRKTDPGPAFPMGSFRARLFGREHDAPAIFATTTNLNIRVGPGTEHARLSVSPLPRGTRVEVLQARGRWRFVDTEGEVGGEADVQGWVHGGYLERAD